MKPLQYEAGKAKYFHEKSTERVGWFHYRFQSGMMALQGSLYKPIGTTPASELIIYMVRFFVDRLVFPF